VLRHINDKAAVDKIVGGGLILDSLQCGPD
jgi:hypothetical protein